MGWGLVPHALGTGRSCKVGGRRVESPLTHNHPTALDGRPQDPVVQQLLQLGDELPPAAPVGGWLQALGGHRHQGRVSQL